MSRQDDFSLAQLDELSALTQLRALRIHGVQGDAWRWQPLLQGLSGLTVLEVEFKLFTAAWLGDMPAMPALQDLDVGFLPAGAFAHLAVRAPNLTRLYSSRRMVLGAADVAAVLPDVRVLLLPYNIVSLQQGVAVSSLQLACALALKSCAGGLTSFRGAGTHTCWPAPATCGSWSATCNSFPQQSGQRWGPCRPWFIRVLVCLVCGRLKQAVPRWMRA